MAKKYDVIIIGAGPGGIFCAYELMEKKPDLKVLMIEKGRSIEKRTCPKRVTKQCVDFKGGCEICHLQSNCPKGQGKSEAASVVLPGYEQGADE